MKQIIRWKRIVILCLLSVSVLAPILLVSVKLKHLATIGGKEFVEDLSSIKYSTDAQILYATEQDPGEVIKEPTLLLYKDENFGNTASYNSSKEVTDHEERKSGWGTNTILESNDTETKQHSGEEKLENGEKVSSSEKLKIKPKVVSSVPARKDEELIKAPIRHDQGLSSRSSRDERVREMKDQLIRAQAFLKFAPPRSNSHLLRELRVRIRELERALGDATKDSDLHRSATQRMRSMEDTLSKASHVFTDCSSMVIKLRAMNQNSEEQLKAQKNQVTYLVDVAGRTTPKGLHCLAMRLTAEYFALPPEARELPNKHRLVDANLRHFAVFSDNVLACAVVVNSTVSTAMDTESIVFHVVTDSLNFPSMTMWFLSNPPRKATIHVISIDNFKWLSDKYGSTLMQQNSHDPRYTSALNHLRFYLPDLFPQLDKIVLLDHDVVVQRDLKALWSINMKGTVNGALQTCNRKMDMLINFSDPMIARKFNSDSCTWAFGMNLYDLREWRNQNLTMLYRRYLQMGYQRKLWMAGSLPIGWVTFYNQTIPLDRGWHLLGLGSESSISRTDIDQAAVIHYDGKMKPWLDFAITRYKSYWTKHIDYSHPFLQECNIHQ